jgi:hypothetical protein
MRNGKKPHSLGSINSTQHSSTERGGNEKKQRRGGFFWMGEGSFETEKGEGRKRGKFETGEGI